MILFCCSDEFPAEYVLFEEVKQTASAASVDFQFSPNVIFNEFGETITVFTWYVFPDTSHSHRHSAFRSKLLLNLITFDNRKSLFRNYSLMRLCFNLLAMEKHFVGVVSVFLITVWTLRLSNLVFPEE